MANINQDTGISEELEFLDTILAKSELTRDEHRRVQDTLREIRGRFMQLRKQALAGSTDKSDKNSSRS